MERRQWRGSLLAAGLLLVAFCWPALAVNQQPTAAWDAAVTLLESLEASGAQVDQIELRATIEGDVLPAAKYLRTKAETWSSLLQLPPAEELKQDKGTYTMQTQGAFGKANLQLRFVGVPQDSGIRTFLLVKLSGERTALADLEHLYQQVTETLAGQTAIPQFSTCIRGIYNDTLGDDQQEGKVFAVLQYLRARQVERLQDETVLSVSAYTGLWQHSIRTGQHKMNLQIATHADPMGNVTRITAGTPIITAEY